MKVGRAPQVLVLDGSPLLRQFYCHVLGNNGFQAVAAGTVKEAKAICSDSRYDICCALIDFTAQTKEHTEFVDSVRKMPTRKAKLPIISLIHPETDHLPLLRIAQRSDCLIVRGDFDLPRLYFFVRQFIPPRKAVDMDESTVIVKTA